MRIHYSFRKNTNYINSVKLANDLKGVQFYVFLPPREIIKSDLANCKINSYIC
jgi:hypothetical protein